MDYHFFPSELDLFELVRDDHARQRERIAHLIMASARGAERRSLLMELITDLRAHAAAEQRTLYAMLQGQEAGQLSALCCIDEHRAVEGLLPDLLMLVEGSDEAAWRRALMHMQREVESHQEEEEHAIFCLLGEQISPLQRSNLARDYQREIGLQRMLMQLEVPA